MKNGRKQNAPTFKTAFIPLQIYLFGIVGLAIRSLYVVAKKLLIDFKT